MQGSLRVGCPFGDADTCAKPCFSWFPSGESRLLTEEPGRPPLWLSTTSIVRCTYTLEESLELLAGALGNKAKPLSPVLKRVGLYAMHQRSKIACVVRVARVQSSLKPSTLNPESLQILATAQPQAEAKHTQSEPPRCNKALTT